MWLLFCRNLPSLHSEECFSETVSLSLSGRRANCGVSLAFPISAYTTHREELCTKPGLSLSAKRLQPQPSLAQQQNSSNEVERGSALRRWPQPEGNKGPLHTSRRYTYPGGSACSCVLLKGSSICRQSQEFPELQVQPWVSKISGPMDSFFPRLYLWLQNSGDSERVPYTSVVPTLQKGLIPRPVLGRPMGTSSHVESKL